MSQAPPLLAQIRYTLGYIFSCSCLPNPRAPPSPTLSAQEGELEGLLFDARPELGGDDSGWRDDDLDDALSLRGVGRRGFRRTQPKKSKREMLGGLFGRRTKEPPNEPSSTSGHRSADTGSDPPARAPGAPQRSNTSSSTHTSSSAGLGSDLDDDAESIGENTLAALPDLAKKWEPEVSLEELAREEEDQARRERDNGRARAKARMAEVDEEFGDFEDGESTPRGRQTPLP